MQAVIHGVKTHWEEMGTGPTLVLLHGWGCDWQIWYPLIAALSEKHRLILPDLPAFGTSADPATVWTSSEYVTWLEEFVTQTVGKKPFVLIGHSFGGKLAIQFAAAHPSALKQLILIDAAGLPPALTPRQIMLKTVSQLTSPALKAILPRAVLRKLLTQLGLATDHLDSSPRQREILQATIRESVAAQLPQIKSPTLIVWGEHDGDTPLSAAQEMAKKIPQAQLEILKNAGHFPFVDQAENTLRLLTAFLHQGE